MYLYIFGCLFIVSSEVTTSYLFAMYFLYRETWKELCIWLSSSNTSKRKETLPTCFINLSYMFHNLKWYNISTSHLRRTLQSSWQPNLKLKVWLVPIFIALLLTLCNLQSLVHLLFTFGSLNHDISAPYNPLTNLSIWNHAPTLPIAMYLDGRHTITRMKVIVVWELCKW